MVKKIDMPFGYYGFGIVEFEFTENAGRIRCNEIHIHAMRGPYYILLRIYENEMTIGERKGNRQSLQRTIGGDS